MYKWAFLFLLTLFSAAAHAQLKTNYRSKTIASNQKTITLDTLSIVPGSVKIYHDSLQVAIDTSFYHIDHAKSQLNWKFAPIQKIRISYRVFPLLFAKRYFHKDARLLENQAIDNRKFYTYTSPNADNTLINLEGLNKSGSISRGVMFGNNQNLSVNSNMVLQMAGKIGNSIEILAAISDDNLPIQPDGNTQQLNDFDRVFIQLKRDSTLLTAGDFELKRPNSYFMNFYKRTQGAMLSHNLETKNGLKLSASLAVAVAKGRSARNTIAGKEGNQGPYRLNGNNAETFIVVIAGTERVYVDGVLMVRGQDNDYVIDYNTAEITFTAKQQITLTSRIVVEFEYSDKNYSRSLTFFNQQITGKKIAVRLNYYNEKDNRNQPFLQPLSDQQKQFLASVGRNTSDAYLSNITEVAFNTGEILYQKMAQPNGNEIYQYSTDPTLAKYRVGFSYMGENKGNYKLSTTALANGKVYEYIAPLGGVKQGDFEPITLLVTPKQLQLVTVAADYQPRKQTLLSAEVALSNNNLNLFAPKPIGDKRGMGLRLKGDNQMKLNTDSLVLNMEFNYEFAAKTFTPLERYRTVEFNRDFNLDAVLDTTDEHLISTKLQLYKSLQKQITHNFSAFLRHGSYQGYLNRILGNYQWRKYFIRYDGSLLNAGGTKTNGKFFRQNIDLGREIGRLVLGVATDHQYNTTADALAQNLTGNSFAWDSYKIYLHTKPTLPNRFKADFGFRKDWLPQSSYLLKSSSSKTANFGLELTKNANSQLHLTAGYRKTDYFNGFGGTTADENLLGRIDYNLHMLKGFINTSLFYEIGNGQEPKRDITYLEVLPGQGIYAWNDYNNNNVKELNEFEIARFPDQAKFIRIFTSTTAFVRTNFTGINQSLHLQPAKLIKTSQGFGKFISRFSNQLSYKVDRKIMAATNFDKYNPFDVDIDANNLISLSSIFRNTLFFNRDNPSFGIDLNYVADGSKIYLSNGFDSRNRNQASLRLRTSPWRNTNLNLTTNRGQKKYSSELYMQRSYIISFLEVLPEINYQFNTDFRVVVTGAIGRQSNSSNYGGETNTNLVFGTESRYNILKKGILTAKANYIKNQFNGNANSTTGYEMLNGLQTGNNFTWGLGIQRNIGNGIQLNLNYDGRKSGNAKTVHTGNMQVRAYF